MVISYSILIYQCICDNCGAIKEVQSNKKDCYNRAQAVRSIKWSYGKDRKVFCKNCRKHNYKDNYKYI